MFTGNTTLDIIILAAIGLVFIASIISLMIYNPNYSFKELLKKPWLIFDLIRHASDKVDNHLKDAQESLDKLNNTVDEVKEEIDELKSKIKK